MRTIFKLVIMVVSIYGTIYAGKVDKLKDEIQNGTEKVKALLELNRYYQRTNNSDEALSYYEMIQRDYSSDTLAAVAGCLSVKYMLRKKLFTDVIAKCIMIKNNYKGTYWAAECLYNLGEIYYNIYEDRETGQGYFEELTRDYADNELARQAKIYLNTN